MEAIKHVCRNSELCMCEVPLWKYGILVPCLYIFEEVTVRLNSMVKFMLPIIFGNSMGSTNQEGVHYSECSG